MVKIELRTHRRSCRFLCFRVFLPPALLSRVVEVVGPVELGELVCDTLTDAQDLTLLRFAISSTEVRGGVKVEDWPRHPVHPELSKAPQPGVLSVPNRYAKWDAITHLFQKRQVSQFCVHHTNV